MLTKEKTKSIKVLSVINDTKLEDQVRVESKGDTNTACSKQKVTKHAKKLVDLMQNQKKNEFIKEDSQISQMLDKAFKDNYSKYVKQTHEKSKLLFHQKRGNYKNVMLEINFSQYKKTDKNIKKQRIHFQQICTTRNARRSSLGRRERNNSFWKLQLVRRNKRHKKVIRLIIKRSQSLSVMQLLDSLKLQDAEKEKGNQNSEGQMGVREDAREKMTTEFIQSCGTYFSITSST